jgi:peptide/nickel transport system permease protein
VKPCLGGGGPSSTGLGPLTAYALRRLGTLVIVVVLSVAVVFVTIGSVYGSIRGHVTVWHQLGRLPGHLVRVFGHLDLGYDERRHQLASTSLWEGLPVDAAVMLGGLACGIVIGILCGLIGGPRPKSAVDSGLLFGSSVVLSVPVYLVAAVVIYEFSNTAGTHQIGFISGPGDYTDYTAITRDPIAWLHAMWVPWLIVGAPLAAVIYRMTRSGMREEMGADYVRTARAKGLTERLVFRRHAFRAALPTALGTVSVTAPAVVVNTILLETAMEMPGLFTRLDVSQQAGEFALTPPFPIMEALVLETTILIATGIFVCDLLHAWLDPKIRR